MKTQCSIVVLVPKRYNQLFSEAKKSIKNNCPTGAVLVLKSLLERLIKDELVKAKKVDEFKANFKAKFKDKKKLPSLYDEIEYFLKNLDIIPIYLKDQLLADLHSIRQKGNNASHPEYATSEKDLDNRIEITLDEAQCIYRLLEKFLTILFMKPFKSDKSEQMSRIVKNRKT